METRKSRTFAGSRGFYTKRAAMYRDLKALNTIIKAEKLHEEYERMKSLPGSPG